MSVDNEQILLINDALLQSDYTSSPSEKFDDDIADPDFYIAKNATETDNLDGILCLESDSECEHTIVENDDLNTIEDSGDELDELLLTEPSTSVGRKRSNPSVWKRNVEKTKKVKGIEFINSFNNKIIKKRQIGIDFKYIYKYFSKFNDEEINKIIEIFNTISSKNKQDTYLCGLITYKKL